MATIIMQGMCGFRTSSALLPSTSAIQSPCVRSSRIIMRPMCRMCSCPHAAGNVGLRSSLPGPPPQQHTFGGISTLPTSKRHAQSTVAQAMPHLTATIALFTASTIFAGVIALLMIAFPSWPRTRQLVESPWVLAPIALVYGVLLVWSWQPDTFSLILPGSLEEGFKGGFNPQFFPSLVSKTARRKNEILLI